MIDVDSFKSSMRRLAAGVSVIATSHDGERYGILVTSVISLSAAPPSVLISINQQSSIHDPLLMSGHFCVNILSGEQQDLATGFATSNGREARFAAGKWTNLSTGSPALEDALVSLDCRITEQLTAHSHTLFIGEIVTAKLWHDAINPLIYVNGSFVSEDGSARAA